MLPVSRRRGFRCTAAAIIFGTLLAWPATHLPAQTVPMQDTAEAVPNFQVDISG